MGNDEFSYQRTERGVIPLPIAEIYLDNAATTKVSDSVIDEMNPYLSLKYGNPGSPHSFGRDARRGVDLARERVSKLIGCNADNIVFTSCGSESNTTAIMGLLDYMIASGKTRVISSLFEHKSVMKTLNCLEGCSITVDRIIGRNGFICGRDIDIMFQSGVDPESVGMVSVMHINNETGIVNDIKSISEICQKYGIVFMTDAVQSFGYAEILAERIGLDIVSVSGHKIHAPKGIGALYISDRCKEHIRGIINGGDQEYGIRAGTENVAGIVGFGRASKNAFDMFDENKNKLSELHSLLESKLIEIDGAHINFQDCPRCNKTTSVRFDGVDAETLVMLLDQCGVYVSSGSACSLNKSIPSYVLLNGGLTKEQAMSTIRISISTDTSVSDIVNACKIISNSVTILRRS